MIWAFLIGFVVFFLVLWFKTRFKDHLEAVFSYRVWPVCENCHTMQGLALEESRTCYPTGHANDEADFGWEWPKPHKDPNRSVLLCRRCAEHHHEYWDDMWAEYYRGRL